MTGDYVYQTESGSQWHWSVQSWQGTRTACADQAVQQRVDPASVPKTQRCGGSGCRHRWNKWLAQRSTS